MPDLAMYHLTSRVVHRQFLFQAGKKVHFRMLMRTCLPKPVVGRSLGED